MARIQDEAICVRHWDWSETSQTVSLLTRDHGIVRGLAKGAKRESGSFSGGLELASRGTVHAILKPHAGLATLTSWDLLGVPVGLRQRLSVFQNVMLMLDLVHHLLTDADPHPPVYDALALELDAVGKLDIPMESTLRFLWVVLGESGYRPVIACDARTGEDLPDRAALQFSPESGGFVTRAAPGETIWKVRVSTLELLRSLDGSDGQLHTKGGDAERVDRAVRLLISFTAHVLGRPLPSAEALSNGKPSM